MRVYLYYIGTNKPNDEIFVGKKNQPFAIPAEGQTIYKNGIRYTVSNVRWDLDNNEILIFVN